MATTLEWKEVVEGDASVQEAFVQDATNKAFSLRQTGVKWEVESHITGAEGSNIFDIDTDAKAYADDLLVSKNVPQFGTQIDGNQPTVGSSIR